MVIPSSISGIRAPRILATLGIAVFASVVTQATAGAQSILYATTEDFGQFNYGGGVTSTTFYSVFDTVNGLGNTSNPGATGTAGSLQLTTTDQGWGSTSGTTFSGPSAALFNLIAPGSTSASMTAASGVLRLDVLTLGFDSSVGVQLWMQGQGYSWHSFDRNSNLTETFTGADGNTWTRFYIPYTTDAAVTGGWFQMGINEWGAASDAGKTLSIDNIQVTAVPEPHEYAVAIVALLGVMIVARRRQQA